MILKRLKKNSRIETEVAREVLNGFDNISLGKYGYRTVVDIAMEDILENRMSRKGATSYIKNKMKEWERSIILGSRVFDTPLLNESQIFLEKQISLSVHAKK